MNKETEIKMLRSLEAIFVATIIGYSALFAAHLYDFAILIYTNKQPGVEIRDLPCKRISCKCGCEDKQPCRCAAYN